MLRIPAFQKGNAINRQFKNIVKSKSIVTGMAALNFGIAANAATSHEAIPSVFFGIGTCFFLKRRKQFSYLADLYRPEMIEILKRALRLRHYKINKIGNKGV